MLRLVHRLARAAHGFWLAVLLGVAALPACDDEDCSAGSEGCACFPNQTCVGELTCASGFCVDLRSEQDGGDAGAAADASGGGPGADAAARDGAAPDGGSAAQGDACETTGDCAALPSLCRMAVCLAKVCTMVSKPVGTAIDDPMEGDCLRLRCAAGGEVEAEIAPSDVPEDDGDPCTSSTCNDGNPMHVPSSAGTPTPASSQTEGDCLRVVCDGEGGVTSEVDADDPPPAPGDDACRVGSCEAGSTSTAPAPPGTKCEGDRVCDADGECVDCKADGMACSASAECCGGLCLSGQCGACPAGTADCDGVAGNACEVSITTSTLHCQGCNVDCNGRPHVAATSCGPEGCRIARCAGGRADDDGDFENGCEAEAEVGDDGAYAPCTSQNASQVCGVGERCTFAVLESGILFQFRDCLPQNQKCYCAYPCSSPSTCPAAPSGSDTRPACSAGYCSLSCTPGTMTCPNGMQCASAAFPGNPPTCVAN